MKTKLHYNANRMKFSQLKAGDRFEFTSARDFPYSGMERGPWVKSSERKYSKPGMDCRVGSISTTVFRITEVAA